MPGSTAGHLYGFRIFVFLLQVAEEPEAGDAADQERQDDQKTEDERGFRQGDKNRSRAVGSADDADAGAGGRMGEGPDHKDLPAVAEQPEQTEGCRRRSTSTTFWLRSAARPTAYRNKSANCGRPTTTSSGSCAITATSRPALIRQPPSRPEGLQNAQNPRTVKGRLS